MSVDYSEHPCKIGIYQRDEEGGLIFLRFCGKPAEGYLFPSTYLCHEHLKEKSPRG